jgi:N-carbamoyl-L-amino-acid hydrolase
VAAAFRNSGYIPHHDITVMAIRGEEASSWFGGSHNGHIGSRSALGLLQPAELERAVSIHTGRTLGRHIREAGFDPEAMVAGCTALDRRSYLGFVELHIEQGPVLEARGVPVGIVTGIRGSNRLRNARCLGEYTHSGAVPHEYRKDAVLATVELLHELDLEWSRVREAGGDLVFTAGKLYTDPGAHALTKVPGETSFTVDFRSQELATLEAMAQRTRELADGIAPRRGVRFELDEFNLSAPALMDGGLRAILRRESRALGIDTLEMPSGAGHDAQDFVHAGFPAAMIFVRNGHGSHNPAESLDMADFALGIRLLARFLMISPASRGKSPENRS